jgi:hypothetical protein
MSPPGPVYDVPRGQFNWANYQSHQVSFIRLEYQSPTTLIYEVPRGPNLFYPSVYDGWMEMPFPIPPQPAIPSSVFTTLPPVGPLTGQWFPGVQASTPAASVTPFQGVSFLPLVGVGLLGP